MDQRQFFLERGFEEEVIKGRHWYLGPDNRYFRIEEYKEYIAIIEKRQDNQPDDNRLHFYRIMREADMLFYMRRALDDYLQATKGDPTADSFYRDAGIFRRLARYVRAMIGKEIGPDEWNNLCCLYDAAVRAGGDSYLVSETCKEVMKLSWMQSNDYILPEMHEMLVHIPDSYYDFVLESERVLEHNNALQERVMDFIRSRDIKDTASIITYISFLNENSEIPDLEIDYLHDLMGDTECFSGKTMKALPEEVLEHQDKHDWRISTIYVQGLIYQIRHWNGICFIDYQDKVIGHCVINKRNEETAFILSLEVHDSVDYPGIRARLLDYAEHVVKNAGFSRVLHVSRKSMKGYYESKGYCVSDEAVESGDIDWANMIIMEKTLS